MLYLKIAVLFVFFSLMFDIAVASSSAIRDRRAGRKVAGRLLFPGLLLFPAAGCGLAWLVEWIWPGYALLILGTIALLGITVACGFWAYYSYLFRRLVRGPSP